MINKENYSPVAKSNGYTVIIKRTDGQTTKYTTEKKEQYVVPFTFNAFHRKETLIKGGIKEKASVVLQSLGFIGINLKTKEGYKSISNFKPVTK